jgi:hypothetical protein
MISIPGECVRGIGPHFKKLGSKTLEFEKNETPSCLPRVPLLLVLRSWPRSFIMWRADTILFLCTYGKALKGEFFLE